MTGVQRYRKRPVEVDAAQWDGTAEGATPIIDWVLDGGGTATYSGPDEGSATCPNLGGHGVWVYCPTCSYSSAEPQITIRTLEGSIHASAGDFVIRGVQGEFYPCKPDIFAQTYEPAVAP